ncbi:MAG TPA: phosphate ABC transporter substrate-binding protein PstS [Trebonia sp.]|jgi:phosphate transport system substrate-binding protein|nr:phosphate ABC transporter substrate-binding protein PstS [Trebonia sp.]
MQLRGRKQAITAGGAIIAAALLAACSSSSSSSSSSSAPAGGSSSSAGGSSSSAPAASGSINAGGSTFQTNFQQAAIQAFGATNPNVKVNYDGVGSGAGRADLYGGTVLIAGSDSPVPASETAKLKGKAILYFPVQIGPIAIAYNLPGVSGLKLNAKVLAGIFSGTIKTWNDAQIKALNPSASLPGTAITLAVRSDSSGTTQNFSQYLVTAAGSAWSLGSASTIKWPSTAHAASGGSGVASEIKSTQGSIGYVDFSTASASSLSAASILNSAGSYVAPSSAGATAAATHVTPKADLTFTTVDEPGADSYPITYQSWDIVYAQQTAANAALIKSYLGFLLSSQGQALLTPLNLAPLPSSIDQAAVAQLDKITTS